MDVDMLGMAIHAAEIIVQPERLMFLSFGVLMGLILGVIPGLGGLVGLSLLLPFTFDMDPYTAFAFMMGLSSVTVTSDSIPAVLFGVPGTIGSAATIVDGYPMARKGEAGRAFGAAFSASVMGGLFGALLLGVSVPVLRPLVLAIGSPELLSFCIFGLSLVAVLSGGSPLKGLAGACIGLMVATVGDDPQTGTLRWTFGSLYLWDGMPIVPFALGLFAIPELGDLAIARRSIAGDHETQKGLNQLVGVRDTFRHAFLVLRCSAIGSVLGAVPGIGASVIDWIAYGHAARTERGAEKTFGSGDVRGVIASESSNNAKEGGALVPTVAFGVPGSASMALILGAFLIHGLVPGPDMLTKRLDVTYTLVWSVAIANILGAGICFAFANQLAKIAIVRVGILVPLVIAVTYVGAYQGSKSWGDIYALLGFGLLGWVMKRLRWPRPPLILGFVLGGLVERYMFISVERYGWTWLEHWLVLVMFAVTLYGILSPVIRNYLKRAGETRPKSVIGFRPDALNPDTGFCFLIVLMFAATLVRSSEWDFGARLVPQVVGWAGLLFAGLLVALRLFVSPAVRAAAAGGSDMTPAPAAGAARRPPAEEEDSAYFDIRMDFGDIPGIEVFRRALVYFGWCVGLLGLAAVIGLMPAMFVYMVLYMRLHGRESWGLSLTVGAGMWVLSYLLFHQLLVIPWPQSLLGDLFPALRSTIDFNLF